MQGQELTSLGTGSLSDGSYIMLSLYDLLVSVAFNWFSVFCGFVLLLFCYSILIKASCHLRSSRT